MRKRITFTIICFMLLCALSMPVSAAGLTKSQKQVKKVVTTLLKSCKNYDAAKIRKCYVNPNKVKVFYKNKPLDKFMRKINKKFFSYSIGDISVKGKKATVKVNLKCWKFTTLFNDVFNDVIEYNVNHPHKSAAAIRKYTYESMLYFYDEYDFEHPELLVDPINGGNDGFESETCTLKLIKRNGKWKIEYMSYTFRNYIHGFYSYTYDQFFE